jgi:hypothetical protein
LLSEHGEEAYSSILSNSCCLPGKAGKSPNGLASFCCETGFLTKPRKGRSENSQGWVSHPQKIQTFHNARPEGAKESIAISSLSPLTGLYHYQTSYPGFAALTRAILPPPLRGSWRILSFETETSYPGAPAAELCEDGSLEPCEYVAHALSAGRLWRAVRTNNGGSLPPFCAVSSRF